MTILTKDYTPPQPPIAPVAPVAPTPAWEQTIPRVERRCYDPFLYDIIDPVTGEPIGIGVAPGFCDVITTFETISHPATPGSSGSPGVPAMPADYMEGWNAGATSEFEMAGNGQFVFRVPPTTMGAVCGLATMQMSTTWGSFPWAFKVSTGGAEVVELGATMVSGLVVGDNTVLTIARVGSQIRYFVGDELVYTSLTPVPDDEPNLWACSALYRGLDTIVDAAFEELSLDFAGVEADDFAGELGQLIGWFSEDGAASLTGVLPPLVGAFVGESNVLTGVLGQLKPSLGGGGLSAIIEGELGQLVGSFETGLLAPAVGVLDGYLSGFASFFIGLPGGVGELEGTLTGLTGFASNVGYGVMQGTLGGLVGKFGTPTWLRPAWFEITPAFSGEVESQRALTAELTTDPALSAALTVTRIFSGELTTEPSLSASLAVSRTLGGELTVEPSLSAALAVSRTLGGEMAVGPSLSAGLLLTRTLGGELTVEPSLTARLTVARAIKADEIICSPNDDEGVIMRPPDNSITVETV